MEKELFGRFCNYCVYWIEGKDDTGKKENKENLRQFLRLSRSGRR